MKYNSSESSIKSCSETNVYIRMLETWDHVDIIRQMSWGTNIIFNAKRYFYCDDVKVLHTNMIFDTFRRTIIFDI